jgi:hypothetical protein
MEASAFLISFTQWSCIATYVNYEMAKSAAIFQLKETSRMHNFCQKSAKSVTFHNGKVIIPQLLH